MAAKIKPVKPKSSIRGPQILNIRSSDQSRVLESCLLLQSILSGDGQLLNSMNCFENSPLQNRTTPFDLVDFVMIVKTFFVLTEQEFALLSRNLAIGAAAAVNS